MDVLVLQIFVSFVLVASSILLFALSAKQKDHTHADRLSLLPIEEEHTAPPKVTPPPPAR
jgi:hypothetical protein